MRKTPKSIALLLALATGLTLAGCAGQATPEATAPTATPAVVAPAHADGYGLTAGTGPVQIGLWTDLSCPHCANLEREIGEDLTKWVDDGEVTLTIHPLNFVSAKRGDTTDWSTRAANALAAAADAGQSNTLPALYSLLQKHQVSDAGAPTDTDILVFASEAGVTADISKAVKSQRFADWVDASNEHWLGATIEGTDQVVQGVPILTVDGKVFDIQSSGNAYRLKAAVEAATKADQ